MSFDPMLENLKAHQFADTAVFEDADVSLNDSYFDYDHESEGGPVKLTKQWERFNPFDEPQQLSSPEKPKPSAIHDYQDNEPVTVLDNQKHVPMSPEYDEPEPNTSPEYDEPEPVVIHEKKRATLPEPGIRASPRLQQKAANKTTPQTKASATRRSHAGPDAATTSGLTRGTSYSSLPDSGAKTTKSLTRHGSLRSLHREPQTSSEASETKTATVSRHASLRSSSRSRPVDSAPQKTVRANSLSRHLSLRSSSRDRRPCSSGSEVGGESSHTLTRQGSQRIPKPKTPEVLKRTQGKTKEEVPKTSEQLEMERIQELREELSRKRQLANQSHKAVQKSCAPAPVHSRQAPTRPEEFHMATSGRVKNPQVPLPSDANTGDFAHMLRKFKNKSPSTRSKPVKAVTATAPFQFADRKRRSEDPSASSKFKSDAEKVKEFANKTPTRFHSKPQGKGPSPCKKGKQELTRPMTPKLVTRARTRSAHVESQAEKEERELEEMKRYQFRARPINDNISHPPAASKRVPPKEATRPEGFDLETEKRGKKATPVAQPTEERYEFRARPVNQAMLNGPTGIKPLHQLPITQPQSPAFALKNRVREPRQPAPQEKEAPVAYKRPLVHTGIPFIPSLDGKVTKTKPFSFEERDNKAHQRKEDKIREALEEEKKMRMFQAQPLPDPSPDDLPQVNKKSLTRPEPFELECELRGKNKAKEWSQKQEEMLKQQRQQMAFKAHPPTVLRKEPFHPAASDKPLTDISEVMLNTEVRAEKRHDWESSIMDIKQQQMAEHNAALKRQQQEEEMKFRKLRQEAVHRAQPVRHYRHVDIKPSDRPLTEAESPRFSERLKAKPQTKC